MILEALTIHSHARRAVEVSLVGAHAVSVIALDNQEDAHAIVRWAGAYGARARMMTYCPCGRMSARVVALRAARGIKGEVACSCSAVAILRHQESADFKEARSAPICVVIPPREAGARRQSYTVEEMQERVHQAKLVKLVPGTRGREHELSSFAHRLLTLAHNHMPYLAEPVLLAVSASCARLEQERIISARSMAEAIEYRYRARRE